MARSIPAYICGACGRGFASARSARRHVKDLESGSAQLFTEADYRIGLSTGVIPIPVKATVAPRFKKQQADPYEFALEEFKRGFYRKLGERAVEETPSHLTKPYIDFFMHNITIESLKAARDISS